MGSGGGGSAGSTDYPAYMKEWHGRALDDNGVDTIDISLTSLLNTAIVNSPYTGAFAYDPDAPIAAWEAAISGFDTILAGINESADVLALYGDAVAGLQNELDLGVDSFADNLDDQLLTITYPRFEGGMRDINAVQSSAFVIGKSILEGFRNRDVAKYSTDLRLNAAIQITGHMVNLLTNKYAWEESYMKTVVESNRIKIVAKGEETGRDLEIDDLEARWGLDVYKYGSNLLASISGAAVQTGSGGPSKTQSAVGGAMAGAAGGAMIGASIGTAGGPYGAAIGTVAGGVLGAAQAYL